jgi:hypothetical protein
MLHVDPWIGFTLAALSGLVLWGCATAAAPSAATAPVILADTQTPIAAAPRPPPPRRAEIPPPAPSPQVLWKYGHWRWNGQQYVWVPGRYVQRPSPTANWIPDYWEQGPEGWMWVEGQWTS